MGSLSGARDDIESMLSSIRDDTKSMFCSVCDEMAIECYPERREGSHSLFHQNIESEKNKKETYVLL